MEPTHKPKIAVIGAGAIGGVTAAFLTAAGWDPIVVTKHPDSLRQSRDPGLEITGIKGNLTVPVRAVQTIGELPDQYDFVLHATRANESVSVAHELLPVLSRETTVVSLQNGICEEALRNVVGEDRIIGCVVGWGASHIGPGKLEVTSPGEFVIGRLDSKPDNRLIQLQRILNDVQPTRTSRNILGELYSKLVVNSCINPLGVITGIRLGKLLAIRKVRRILLDMMREAIAVSDAMGLHVEPAAAGKLNFYDLMEGESWFSDFRRDLVIRIIGLKYRRIRSSSLQALERGRMTEMDYLNGYVCEKAAEFDVSVPLHSGVLRMVHEIETGNRSISLENLDDPLFSGR